jgi:hypothetical protein
MKKIDHWRTVGTNAHGFELGGHHPVVEPNGFAAKVCILLIEWKPGERRGDVRPFGRAEAAHAPAFLINKNERIAARGLADGVG